MKLIKKEFDGSPEGIVKMIKEKAGDFNFIVREVFDMAEEFRHHDIEVDDGFVYYSIMLCNPEKAYQSISMIPVRGAMLLPPKQVVVYNENGKTIIAYVKQEERDVASLFPEDHGFQKGLSKSCDNIEELIKGVVVDGKI